MFGRTSLTLYTGMNDLLENDFINIKNTSFEIVAEVETGSEPANGVIVAQGGAFGGWSLYAKDGTPTFVYNYLGLDEYKVSASSKLPTGKATVRMDFAYDGGDPGSGGTAPLYLASQRTRAGPKFELTHVRTWCDCKNVCRPQLSSVFLAGLAANSTRNTSTTPSGSKDQ